MYEMHGNAMRNRNNHECGWITIAKSLISYSTPVRGCCHDYYSYSTGFTHG